MTFLTSSLRAAALAFLLGCATPGYFARVQANPFPASKRDDVVSTLQLRAKEKGFSPVVEGREDPVLPGVFLSAYEKPLSSRPRDSIEIHIQYFRPSNTLGVKVVNLVTGADPAVRSEIDALGDMYEVELSSAVGRENVSVERGRTRIPLLQ